MSDTGSIFREKCVIRAAQRTADSCLLTFQSEKIAASIFPGQFVNVLPPSPFKECVPPYRLFEPAQAVCADYNPEDVTLLRRPISLFRVHRPTTSETGDISILFRIIGKGTRLLSELAAGQTLDVLGPLGNPYPKPEKPAQTVFLIAGGFGIAPLLPWADYLVKQGFPVTVFWGVLDIASAPLPLTRAGGQFDHVSRLALSELEQAGIPSLISADRFHPDVFQGNVCALFRNYLSAGTEQQGSEPILYTCGPEIMMKKVTELAQEKNWRCRVSLEKYMACGLGACMSCVCKLKDADRPAYYARTCTDGPSFWGDEIVW